MAIEFKCPVCDKPHFAQDQHAGKLTQCSGCGTKQTIPAPVAQAVAAEPAAVIPAMPAAVIPVASQPPMVRPSTVPPVQRVAPRRRAQSLMDRFQELSRGKQIAIIVAFCVSVILFFVVLAVLPKNRASRDRGSDVSSSALQVGDDCRLNCSGEDKVWVAASEDAHERLTRLSNAKDYAGIRQMIAQDQVYVCSQDTSASMVEPGFTTHKVLIMDGPHAGKSGYLPSEFVKK